ncbi:hypothetical protein [Pseudomonas syringae]|uniref:hypothetical protein n=1 Tax=Pseudomonas syringae TaxID=317 RepID=UPI001F475633|nr:hypothetical protein [Pseudomonas syringae]MCF5371353.1 hypothetical protein [Pseudomonas syringae]
MKAIQQSALPILIKAAFADAQFKVMKGIWQKDSKHCLMSTNDLDTNLYPSEKWGTTDEHRFDRNHPYFHACDEARELCVELGRFCRENALDVSASPLLKSLHFMDTYSEAYEKGRVVSCEILTPKVLHDSVQKRNVLHWDGWTITAGEREECDDAYGIPTEVRPLVAIRDSDKSGFVLLLPGESSKRAKEAYKLITGSPFIGEDGLEADLPHFFER